MGVRRPALAGSTETRVGLRRLRTLRLTNDEGTAWPQGSCPSLYVASSSPFGASAIRREPRTAAACLARDMPLL